MRLLHSLIFWGEVQHSWQLQKLDLPLPLTTTDSMDTYLRESPWKQFSRKLEVGGSECYIELDRQKRNKCSPRPSPFRKIQAL